MSYIVIMVMSALDHYFTWLLLVSGWGREINPFMLFVMSFPFWLSFFIKNVWTAMMLCLLYILSKKKSHQVKMGLKYVLLFYGLVLTYHLWGIGGKL